MRSRRYPFADRMLLVVAALGVSLSFWWSEPTVPEVPQPVFESSEQGVVAVQTRQVADGIRIATECVQPTAAFLRPQALPHRRTWALVDEDDDFELWLEETQRDRRRGGLGRVRDRFGANARR